MDQVRFKLDGDRFVGGSQGRCTGRIDGGKRLMISALAAVAILAATTATAMLWPPSTKVSAGTACGEVPVMVALRLFLPDCIEPFRLNVRCALLGAAAKDNPMHARR
jgi:hypothetical protein